MGYARLRVPTSGYTEFTVYRSAYDDQIEVVLGEESYVFEDVAADNSDLALWLRQVGVVPSFINRFIDLMWNFRRIHYDLSSHRYTVPKSQAHPLSIAGREPRNFRIPRDPGPPRDIFDPLQDRRVPSMA